ncbi:MAG: hypothetical protein ACI9KE_005476 [Polyangiales bacterium]
MRCVSRAALWRVVAAASFAVPGCDSVDEGVVLSQETGASELIQVEPTNAPSASISALMGDVRVQVASTAHWGPGTLGQGLLAGESVQTMALARATISFASARVSTVMEPRTTLRIPAQVPHVGRLRHLSGQLRARIDGDGGVERLEVALPPGELVLLRSETGDAGYVEARIEIHDEIAEIAMLSGSGRLAVGVSPERSIDEAQFVQISMDGVIVDEGADLPAPAELLQPGTAAEILTRGSVQMRWAPVASVERYEVIVRGPNETTERQEVGATHVRFALASGEYVWSVRALTPDGHGHESPRAHFRVVLDRTPPRITLLSPSAGQVVQGAAVVSGRTEAGAVLTINGDAVHVRPDGSFRSSTPVRRGLTNIVVVARDSLGNSRTTTRSVLRQR